LNAVYLLHSRMMSLAVNWQLQIKLEFYVENIVLKGDPCNVFTGYLLF